MEQINQSSFKKNYVRIALECAWAAKRDKKRKRHGEFARLASIRFIKDLAKCDDERNDFYFDEWEANNPCDFIEKLPHVEGVWNDPAIRLEPWQIFNTVNIFGFRRRSDGYRRFNTVYFEVARKNAKSTWGAGIAIYSLNCENENGPQCLTAATTGKQARIVFNIAKKMIERTPDLMEAFNLKPMANAIVNYENGGSLHSINSKAETQDGLNPHFALLDELHAHKTRDLFDVLKSARGARKNPLSVYITTAGYNVTGVCYEQRSILVKILQGVIKGDHYYGIIYTLDSGDDEFDESNWVKANPNLNVSVQLHEFRGYAEEARISPASHGEFKTKRLNIWTSARGAWVSIPIFKKCSQKFDFDNLLGIPCYGGLDLASTKDFAAFSLVWKIGEHVFSYSRLYLPGDVVKPKTEKGNVPFQVWADAGYITVTPGNVIDYAYIEKDIQLLLGRFDVQNIAYDEWNATDITNRLDDDGAPLTVFRQGPKSYNRPMVDFERAYTSGNYTYYENPCFEWMVSNLVAREDVNKNKAPDKKNSLEKIDGPVSMLMAWGLMLDDDPDDTSVYGTKGF